MWHEGANAVETIKNINNIEIWQDAPVKMRMNINRHDDMCLNGLCMVFFDRKTMNMRRRGIERIRIYCIGIQYTLS